MLALGKGLSHELGHIFRGLGAVAMFALGFNIIVPLSATVDTLCDLAGIICFMVFFGLTEDAGAHGDRSMPFDRE